MKIHRLSPDSARSSRRIGRVTALGAAELQQVSAGVEPFSCAYVEDLTIKYHSGYPRSV